MELPLANMSISQYGTQLWFGAECVKVFIGSLAPVISYRLRSETTGC